MQNLENEKNAFFEKGYITFNINDERLIDSVNYDVN